MGVILGAIAAVYALGWVVYFVWGLWWFGSAATPLAVLACARVALGWPALLYERLCDTDGEG